MREQYDLTKNPNEEGVVTKIWKSLGQSNLLRESILEYFKVAYLCLTMKLGLVALAVAMELPLVVDHVLILEAMMMK